MALEGPIIWRLPSGGKACTIGRLVGGVMKIGVSGHRHRDGADWAWTRDAIVDIFLSNPKAVGWSSLAAGADQIFAEAALSYGAGHVAVIPTIDSYRDYFAGRDLDKYDSLLARSKKLIRINGRTPEEAFRKAGERVVRASNLMVLVWDGEPARGEGGAGDIAAYAEKKRVKTIWLNPADAKRRLSLGVSLLTQIFGNCNKGQSALNFVRPNCAQKLILRRAYSLLPWAMRQGKDEALMSALLQCAFSGDVALHTEKGLRKGVGAAGPGEQDHG